jgi:hypothetical protein
VDEVKNKSLHNLLSILRPHSTFFRNLHISFPHDRQYFIFCNVLAITCFLRNNVATINFLSILFHLMKSLLFLAAFCFAAFCFAALCASAFAPLSLVLVSQAHLDYSAALTIDGKTSHSYTVQFTQNGDTTRRVTSYYDNGKRLIRQETTNFRAQGLKLFSNKIQDFRTGEYLLQTSSGNRFNVEHRERKGAELEEKSITAENGIVTTLVTERIALSMEALDRGETVSFVLALPLRGIVTEMNLLKSSTEAVGGVACAVIKLEPSNFVFKALMGEPSLFFFERAKPHRLMQYKGIVGLPSAEGKQQSGVAVAKY